MVLCTKALFEPVFAAILWATISTVRVQALIYNQFQYVCKRERERERDLSFVTLTLYFRFLEMLSIAKRDHVYYLDRPERLVWFC